MAARPPKKSQPANDSASGSIAGFIFQFQKALLLLADLEDSKEYISIEYVDDAATHKEDNTVIATAQAKHSVSSSGTTFENTSYALWRTIEIWITKLLSGVFSDKTNFYCTTNKKIPADALLRKLKDATTFEDALKQIEAVLIRQTEKLTKLKNKTATKGKSISGTIELIKFALSNPDHLRVIIDRLVIEDEADFKESFLNKIHAITSTVSLIRQDRIYDEFSGWIINTSLSRWNNARQATITKEAFNNKVQIIYSSPSIIAAIFRTKQALGTIADKDIESRYNELFVRQIEDIKWRKDLKERKIKDAIIEFILHDIELKHVIDNGNYTKSDFEKFLEVCEKTWQEVFDSHYYLELNDYTTEQREEIARKVFDKVMKDIKLEFKDGFSFNTENAYMRNGCFLKLSNVPTIGWHPEWESKYK